MAEPYKRKTRYPGLKEHERLQKQKKADAKKRLKRMKILGGGKEPKLSEGETKRIGTYKEQHQAKKLGPVSGKPLLNGEKPRYGTTQEQHRAKRPSGAWRTPGVGGATGHKYKPGDRLKPGDRTSDIGGGWKMSNPPVYMGQ